MNIASILKEQAQARASSIAVLDTFKAKDRATSFAELDRQAAQIAHFLEREGLKKGDAVLVFQTMSAELYALLSALFRLGLIAVFIDPSAEKGHIERCCQLYPPKALVASTKAHLLRFVSKALRQIPIKISIGPRIPLTKPLEGFKELEPLASIAACSADSPALMTFTSGSTGQPKAAVRSHGFLIAQHKALAKSLHLEATETDVSTLPIFVLANLASGLTSLIPNADLRNVGRVNAAVIFKQLEQHKPQRLSSSPAFLARLIEYAEEHKLKLECLEKVFTGGAPVFPSLQARAQAVFPNASITAVYGSTEAEPIAHIAWHDLSHTDKEAMRQGKGLLVGLVTPDLNLRIIKPLGKTLDLTEDAFVKLSQEKHEVGEIVVSGAHVLHGYLNGLGDEETKFNVSNQNQTQRWHRTGDMGYLDEHNRLWLLGRSSAVLQDNKGTLYPFALECAVSHLAYVKRSAVVLHKGKRLLLIESDEAFNKQVLLKDFAWAKLDAVHKMQLPVDKRHNAKIDYPALKEKLERLP